MRRKKARHSGKQKTEHRGRTKSVTHHLSSVARHPSSVSWQSPDFHLHPHGWAWSVLIVAAALTVAFLFVLYQQYVLALIVGLAGIVMILGTHDKPKMITHSVTPKGFRTGNSLLPWTDIKSFWIVTVSEGNKLHLETIKRGSPIVTVYLGQENPATIRTAIGHYLPEHPTRGEQFTDILARLLRV